MLSFTPPLRRALAVGAAVIAMLGMSACGVTANITSSDEASDAKRDEPAGEITEAATASVFDLRVGDCADQASLTGTSISDVATISCSEPHDAEVYAETELPKGLYPTDLNEQAEVFCETEFATFVGIDYSSSQIYASPLTPTASGWLLDDDRVIQCILLVDEPVTGTLQGAAY